MGRLVRRPLRVRHVDGTVTRCQIINHPAARKRPMVSEDDDDRPWRWSPTIDVLDVPLRAPLGFIWPRHVTRQAIARRAAAANSQHPKETPMADRETAPIYGINYEVEEGGQEPAAASVPAVVDVSVLVGALWDKAKSAQGLDGGELQDVLAAAGVVEYAKATLEDEETSDYLVEGDDCLVLTPAGVKLVADEVTIKFETT